MAYTLKNSLIMAGIAAVLNACATVAPPPPAEAPPPAAATVRSKPVVVSTRSIPPVAPHTAALPQLSEPPRPDPDSNIFFADGSHGIDPSARLLLATVAERVKGRARGDITLIGHTDDAGSTEFNIALAQKRVEAVAAELQALGVSSRQIRRISYGNEASGAFTCATSTCRQGERRVELRLSAAD